MPRGRLTDEETLDEPSAVPAPRPLEPANRHPP
jgi:hypothetical protein